MYARWGPYWPKRNHPNAEHVAVSHIGEWPSRKTYMRNTADDKKLFAVCVRPSEREGSYLSICQGAGKHPGEPNIKFVLPSTLHAV